MELTQIDLARLCNGCLNGALLATLLSLLARTIPTDLTDNPEPEEDCNLGLTPELAAGVYAETAQAYWVLGSIPIKRNPPLVVAVTRARTVSGDCKGYISINSPVGRRYESDLKYLENYMTASLAISAIASASGNEVLWIQSGEGFGIPEESHAERILYSHVKQRGEAIIAIGVSQKPCGDLDDPSSCYSVFTGLKSEVTVGWWTPTGIAIL